MFDKRVNIFVGHFGSGKTEVAVNYALKLAQRRNKICIVDFDIVNPFFRTADAKDKLEMKGIRVIYPMYANTNVDVPALPPEINSVLGNKEYGVVFDVGGDDIGARVLSRYSEDISQDSYEMFFVINPRRPMTDTEDKILEMLHEVETSSRLKVTRLVNNTNILGYTTPEDILKGHELIDKISTKVNIPVGFTSGLRSSIEPIKDKAGNEILILDKLIKLPWDE